MKNQHHREILELIKENSGPPERDAFLANYLGTSHVRYPINAPTIRLIAKEWMRSYKHLPAPVIQNMLSSLIESQSSTEKIMAGVLLDYATRDQLAIDPNVFDRWLDHLEGWAEVDAVCTNKYTVKRLPLDWKKWAPLLTRFSRDKNIHKRRASLVLLCSPLRNIDDERLVDMALKNVYRLRLEKHILITKAISWVLRSAVKHHKKRISQFISEYKAELPAIAVRETMKVLETGKKTG